MADNATESFISCLLKMAEAETNPVLEIIDQNKPLEENKKYPPALLQFNQTGWRAYYHCHPASRAGNHRFKGEHGHFHLFVRIQTDPEEWSHLVALAIDNMGQPLGLFTVNHWVTGEKWESSAVLENYLKVIPYDKQDNMVECWLLSLLSLSCDMVKTVLHQRDKILQEKQLKRAKEKNDQKYDIKQDKDIYVLSEKALNLEVLLNLQQDGD